MAAVLHNCVARRLKCPDPELGAFGFRGIDPLRAWSDDKRSQQIIRASNPRKEVQSLRVRRLQIAEEQAAKAPLGHGY